MKTVILIDSCSDLPLEYVEKNNIAYIPFTYEIKGNRTIMMILGKL